MKMLSFIILLFSTITSTKLGSDLEMTLDLPNGKKTISFSLTGKSHYDPKPSMKKMLKMQNKYVDCIKTNGVKEQSFFKCVGEDYILVIKDYLAIYFEFLKDVNFYLNEQKNILCKTHYSRFCPDIDMFLRNQLTSENLHKETFVRVFKGLNLSEDFNNRGYYDYLLHLFKGIDEIVEMRKLAVSYMTMSIKECQNFLMHFKFLHLNYNTHNMERIKVLMQNIEGNIDPEFIRKLDYGIKKVSLGETISNIPYMPVWGDETFVDEDNHSDSGETEDKGPSVKMNGETIYLDKHFGRDDDFNNSVLREKEYMSLLKNLEARGNIKLDGHDSDTHGGEGEENLFDKLHLDNYSIN